MTRLENRKHPLNRLSAAVVVTAAIALLAGTAAAMGNINISRSPNMRSMGPRIAIDSQGRNHVVWSEVYTLNKNGQPTSGDAYYASSDPTGKVWSTPRRLTQQGVLQGRHGGMIDVDTDDAGYVYIMWVEGRYVRLLIKNPDGTWQPLFNIDDNRYETANCPIMQVDRAGNIFTIWNTSAFNNYSRARVGGVWEPKAKLNNGGAKFPFIGVGSNSVSAIFMERYEKIGYKTKVVRRAKAFGSPWNDPHLIRGSDTSVEDEFQVIQVSPNDQATAVYAAFTGTRVLWASTMGGEGWSIPVPICGASTLHYPTMAQLGSASFCAWQVGTWGMGLGVEYNIRQNGKWGEAQFMPDTGGATHVDLDIHPDGTELRFVWDSSGEIIYNVLAVNATSSIVYAPTSLQVTASFGTAPDVTYTFSWADDPRNANKPNRKFSLYELNTTTGEYTVLQQDVTSPWPIAPRTTLNPNVKFGIAAFAGNEQSEIEDFELDVQTVKAPVDPTVRIHYKNLFKSPSAVLTFSWADENPANFIKTYKIYQRPVGTETWALMATAPGSASSFQQNASAGQRMEFGVSALSIFDLESPIVPMTY